MYSRFGLSIYTSLYMEGKRIPDNILNEDNLVFISLHIEEEFSEAYVSNIKKLCEDIENKGVKIVADVSKKTILQFRESNLIALAKSLGIWALRLDYGFSLNEILELSKNYKVVLNASTLSSDWAKALLPNIENIFAMHNFYPRPETGLDEEFLFDRTEMLHHLGIKVLAFIPGNLYLRGPIFDGLPTLERHRRLPPSVGFLDMVSRFHMDGVFIGDMGITEYEYSIINRYEKEKIIEIPADLEDEYSFLYGQIFTSRVDSPKEIIRIDESREYATKGKEISPRNCCERSRGSITIDNLKYGRYTGEIQIIKSDLPVDERVNVIGKIKESHLLLMDNVSRGSQFVFKPL